MRRPTVRRRVPTVLMIDPAEERWMASRAGARTIEFTDASHVGGITRYAAQFTALVERAALATTR
jgi:hypothetical protein